MASGERSGGLMSSAGLIQYYDNEDQRAIWMDPKSVIAFCIVTGIVVQTMNFIYV